MCVDDGVDGYAAAEAAASCVCNSECEVNLSLCGTDECCCHHDCKYGEDYFLVHSSLSSS